MNDMTPIQTTLKDWESDQEVRWCPGCGDYAILKAVQRTLPQIGADPALPIGVLVAYVCRACGMTELYTAEADRIPIGPQYGTDEVDVAPVATEGPFR